MRLFKSKNKAGKDDASQQADVFSEEPGGSGSSAGQHEPLVLRGTAQNQHQQPQQQQQPMKTSRAFQSLVMRQPRQLDEQDIVKDSIGRFCGLTEDWGVVLELSDNLRNSTASCKVAAEAIRKEFKHGTPLAQERAAKLLVILTRNTSDRFKLQIAESKFLKTYKSTLESQSTDGMVKAMLFKALGTIVWENQDDRDLAPLKALYQEVRPATAPSDGLSVEEGDPTFEPGPDFGHNHRSRRQPGVASNPAMQAERLRQRATVARSEAGMLTETLAFTPAEELESNQIVQEFYKKALSWQQFINEQLAWVQAEAGKGLPETKPFEEALDLLLSANGEINEALELYHSIEARLRRQKQEEQELRLVTERSKQEASRHDQPQPDHLGYGLSSSMAPVASSSGSSNAGSNGQDDDLIRLKPIIQDNNPYAARVPELGNPSNAALQDAASAVLSDRYIIDEPDTLPEAQTSSVRGIHIGDKNPFGAYMKSKEDSFDETVVPKEPSAKALGKLRRVSGQESEVDAQQKRMETELRQKYAQNYNTDQQ